MPKCAHPVEQQYDSPDGQTICRWCRHYVGACRKTREHIPLNYNPWEVLRHLRKVQPSIPFGDSSAAIFERNNYRFRASD